MLGNIGKLFVKCHNVESHKRPFLPSVGGIGLLCNELAEGQISFVKRLQRSTG